MTSSRSRRCTPSTRPAAARSALTRTAREALDALDFLLADAGLDALGELERDPHLGHELRGHLTGLRSYRVGVYRILYQF